MERRPQSNETEDDLLKQQEKFLASTSIPSAKVILHEKRNAVQEQGIQEKRFKKMPENEEQSMETTDAVPNLLLDIVERETVNVMVSAPTPQKRSFPEVHHIKNKIGNVKGRSLFSLHVSKMKGRNEVHAPQEATRTFGSSSVLLDGSGLSEKNVVDEIHKENVQKLSSMSESEILKERQELMKTLDPALITFLQQKKKQKTQSADQKNSVSIDEEMQTSSSSIPLIGTELEKGFLNVEDTETKDHNQSMEMNSPSNDSSENKEAPTTGVFVKDSQFEEKLPIKPSEAKLWPHMDVVEHEKLAWTTDLPKSKDLKSGYAARFNFEGELLSRSEDIPTHAGLHHHAEEPDIPGYTLEELLQYSRSSVSQQRILGLKTLTNVISKSNTGVYDDYLESSLVSQLIEAGIILMLRWAIDDTIEGVREAAIQTLNALLVIPADEICLDRVDCWYRGFETPFLKPHDSVKPSEKETQELTDAELLKTDAIKGLLRIDILPRFYYILTTHRPSAPIVISILEILIRIARHSPESSYAIFRSEKLISFIIENFIPSHWNDLEGKTIDNAYGVPIPQAVKLIRVLASSGKTIAKVLHTDFEIMNSLICYMLLDPSEGRLPLEETLHLILESLSTWHMLLTYGLCSEFYINIFPSLMRQLQYYQQLSIIDSQPSKRYEFDHCAALLKILDAVVHIAAFHSSRANKQINDDCSSVSVTWDHVVGLEQPIRMCLEKWMFELTISDELSYHPLKLVGSALNFLSTFYNKLSLQPSLSVVDTFLHFESMCQKTLIPFLHSPVWKSILSCILKYSNLLSTNKSGNSRDSLTLPTLGSLTSGGSLVPVLETAAPFHFLTSLMNFIVTVSKLNKKIDAKVSNIILSENLITEYIKKLIGINHELANNWFTRHEVHFLYFLLQLGALKTREHDLMLLHHHLAIAFPSFVSNGDEHLVVNVMKKVIFNPSYLINENIIDNFSLLSVNETPHSEPNAFNLKLLQELPSLLPLMLEVYLKAFESVYSVNMREEMYSIDRNQIAIMKHLDLPFSKEWVFKPIKLAFLSGNIFRLEEIQNCIKWLCVLHVWRRDSLQCIPSLNMYCYLACIFLIGNDLFLDDDIHRCLQGILPLLVQREKKERFKMKNAIPVATAFRDFYLQLLTQFEAVSYGDHLFGLMVLLPLQQQYDQQLRIDAWTAHSSILKLLSFNFNKFSLSLHNFFYPLEKNRQLLTVYYQNTISGLIKPTTCPILYALAVHHLHHFLYGNNNSFPQMKSAMINHLKGIRDEDVKKHIEYGGLVTEAQPQPSMPSR